MRTKPKNDTENDFINYWIITVLQRPWKYLKMFQDQIIAILSYFQKI